MNKNMDLSEYMSTSIEKIINSAIRTSLKNPREIAFLVKHIMAQNTSRKRRRAYEEKGHHIPPFLIASITSSCNLFCKGCLLCKSEPLLR